MAQLILLRYLTTVYIILNWTLWIGSFIVADSLHAISTINVSYLAWLSVSKISRQSKKYRKKENLWNKVWF